MDVVFLPLGNEVGLIVSLRHAGVLSSDSLPRNIPPEDFLGHMLALFYWRQFDLVVPAFHLVVRLRLEIAIEASISHVLLVIVIFVGVHCAQPLPHTVKVSLSGLAAELAVGRIGDIGDTRCADAEEEGLIGAAKDVAFESAAHACYEAHC